MSDIKIEIRLPAEVKKKEKWFIASCPDLNVVTQGRTKKEAKKNLVEALTLFLTSCFERNTLETVFKECGITSIDTIKDKPKSNKKDYINIPFYLLSSDTRENHCHA